MNLIRGRGRLAFKQKILSLYMQMQKRAWDRARDPSRPRIRIIRKQEAMENEKPDS
jgi:hypothetical protein